MIFIINKFFIFFSFIFKKKIIQFLKLKSHFSYILILFLIFKPSTALCDENLIGEDEDVKTNSITKKVIICSLICLTLLGIGLFYYYSGDSSDQPFTEDLDQKISESSLARAEEAAAYKAAKESFNASYKIAKDIAVDNWNEAEMNYRTMKRQGGFSREEMNIAIIKRAEAEKALSSIHIAHPCYLYRPFTEKRFVD